MDRMGFNSKWTELVIHCVTIVSYSILINGDPQPSFKPPKDIRQGDLLSPYHLFILCAEALSCLLHRAKSNDNITSLSIGRGLVCINHLLFIDDDSLLFCKANSLE